MIRTLALFVCLVAALGETPCGLHGSITDPSGAAVPYAGVELRGPGGARRAQTSRDGRYSFSPLSAGTYQIKITAPGFAVTVKKDLVIDRAREFNAQLIIQTDKRVVEIQDRNNRLDVEPDSNGAAVIMRQRQIAALSDDPDELALQLQALAGPAPGPNGGQMFVDGFSGVAVPPKSSIREIRVNANPFSAEYDQPGYSRVEIFTKPGSASFHGQAFAQYNNNILNSRNPLLTQANAPPYQTQSYGLSIGGPIRRGKASFTFDGERRDVRENAFILATDLDSGLNPVPINQALASPQTRTSVTPRLDYAITPSNTLVIRYSDVRTSLDNQGVGDFNLASRAYNEQQSRQTLQITETAAISSRTINETRFQYLRSLLADTTASQTPILNVQGAFIAGGATVGDSGSITRGWEVSNVTSHVTGCHTLKWGGRARSSFLTDTSRSNFSGMFTFFTLARYQRTLELEQAGYNDAQIAQMGAGADQFRLNAGIATADVNQTDVGIFFNDDWRVQPNLTVSFGLRYETQNNFGDRMDWAPRAGIAWGLGPKPKTVIRGGAGSFYDRIPLSVTLNSERYNGVAQQSFLITNPVFFSQIPPLNALSGQQPQQLQPFYSGLVAPRIYQINAGIERQFATVAKLSLNWIHSRGVHLPNLRNINAPIAGVYPFADQSVRLLTESAGLMRQNQVVANYSVNVSKVTLFGFYSLSYGKDNNEGFPADSYNLRAEWSPSSYGDVRHRLVSSANIPLPWKLNLSPFLVVNSGVPYNITSGLDPANTGFATARPALIGGPGCGDTLSANCFDLNPSAGAPAIERNFGRGPADVSLGLRTSRTWNFGSEAASVISSPGQHGSGGGPPMEVPTQASAHKYSLTLTASTMNALNRANFAPPDGDLSSPFYGQFRALGGLIVMNHGGGASTYNRKIDLQLRFTF